MIALYGVTGWLIAQERTGAVLAVQAAMNALNVGLDLWFVLGLGWGVTGVAWASFAAEWSGLALGLWLCRGAFAVPAWRDWPRVFDPERLRRMAAVNRDILLRSLMLQAIFVSFVFVGSGFGDVTLAANQVLLQFLHISAYGLDGFAFAAEALVGQAVGRRDVAGMRRGALLAGVWGLAVTAALALAFAALGPAIVALMATAPEVRAAAQGYLAYVALAPLLGLAPFMLDGIFIGATRARDMRNMMALSLAVYAGAVAVLIPGLGNHGLWLALMLSYVVRAATLGMRYPALERAVGGGGGAARE